MQSQKKARIESIDQEVKQLHPLLNALLRKLPGVRDVEHTHGTSEMGADFLFSKDDDILGTSHFAAVVAKVGRIEQGDLPELKRQVTEAFYPKLCQSGKQEITISEVWVITTAHISHNAKIGIRNEFAGRKVEFIPGDKLTELIDKFFPSYWTDVSLELGQYLHSLRVRNEEVERSVSLTNLARDIYIEQELVRGDDEKYELEKSQQRPRPHVDIHNLIRHQNTILIEGDMGAGKSKLIRRLINHYTSPEIYLELLLVPISVSYKDLLDKYDGNFDVLISKFIGEKALKEIPPKARYLILVDGIDEKNLSPEQQIAALNALVKKVEDRSDLKLVLTSRYFGAIDKKGLSRSLSRIELLHLSPSKLLEFVKQICSKANISERIFEDIKHSPLFRDLPRSPIAAILLSNLLNNNSEDLPSNLPELYSKYLELTLGRWDMEKGLQSQKEYEALNSLMMELARLTIENELPYLTLSEVKGLFASYANERNLGVSADRAFALMKDRCTIVSIDEKQDRFYFKHRTFAEYLYAQYLVKKRLFKIDKRAFNPYWENTFYFGIGTLRDCPEELRQLIALSPESDLERFLKIVNMANFLMAAFQTPYKVIAEGIKAVVLEAAEFHRNIVTRRIKTDLEVFPEMQLLHLFQYVMRHGYSYSFFSKAVEQAAIEIASSEVEDDVKAYSLFFLNLIFIQMQKKSSFDWLLKDHAKILPISVQLAISHEGERLKERSALMRKHDRALRHAIKNSKQLSSSLEKIYGRPIRSLRASRVK